MNFKAVLVTSALNNFSNEYQFFFPVTQHGHPDGGVSAMHAEYLRGHSLPPADLDGGNGWSPSVLPDCIALLLLCKYLGSVKYVTKPL